MTGNMGANALGNVLQARMGQNTNKTPKYLDYGTIQGDMSLLLNHFPHPIPQSDYMVCRSVMWGAVGDILYKTQAVGEENSGAHSHKEGGHSGHEGGDGTHTHSEKQGEEHVHDVLIGEKMRWLNPGDRVLVARVGDDFCVIDLIFPAITLGRSNSNSYEVT